MRLPSPNSASCITAQRQLAPGEPVSAEALLIFHRCISDTFFLFIHSSPRLLSQVWFGLVFAMLGSMTVFIRGIAYRAISEGTLSFTFI